MSAFCRACGLSQPRKLLTLLLDHDRHLVHRDNRVIDLTPQEFAVVEALLDAHPRVARKGFVFSHVYDDRAEWDQPQTSKSLDVYVCRLRPILNRLGLGIVTHWGEGWELVDLGGSR